MENIAEILQEGGFEVVEGYEEVKRLIESQQHEEVHIDLCSGYGVFPDGSRCPGCPVCRR